MPGPRHDAVGEPTGAPHRNDKETRAMTRSAGQFLATIAATALLAGCGTMGNPSGWTTLIDGEKGMDNFTRVGDANWTATDGAVQATAGRQGPGLPGLEAVVHGLRDAGRVLGQRRRQQRRLHALPGPQRRSPTRTATKPTSSTSAPTRPTAPARSSRWPRSRRCPRRAASGTPTRSRRAGTQLILVLNGVKTVDVQNSKLASGPFALQWGRGTIKFRKVQIRPI